MIRKYRRRKFTTYKFFVEGQICKIFFQPQKEFEKGFWSWNVGFAVGNSNRQLNDWYWKKKNKRSRSVHRQMTGKVGLKGVTKFFTEILRLRWTIEPGDVLFCDCTSYKPEQQFKVGHRFVKRHPVWTIDYENKIFFWHRPPYANDPIWKDHEIIGKIPANPLQNTENNLYFDCFSALRKDPHTARSKHQN